MAPQCLQKKVQTLAWHLQPSPIETHPMLPLAWPTPDPKRESTEICFSVSAKAPLRTNSFPFIQENLLDYTSLTVCLSSSTIMPVIVHMPPPPHSCPA